MDVESWLKGLGLEAYAPAFHDNKIGGDVLRHLTDDDLKELGVSAIGDRRRLRAAIAALIALDGHTPDTATAPANALILPQGERRQVTIVFADLSAFTTLSSEIDAEELRDLMDRYFTKIDRIVADFGGTVDKHIGDAVMALFGAPIAHSDDPLRAVRAALRIHEAVSDFGGELGRDLKVHLGIACGDVVAGTLSRGAERDYTVVGDAVNLAARLDDMAEPGETFISEAIFHAVSDQIACAPLGEVSVKGLAEPARVWRVTGVHADTATTDRSPLVGRRAELAQFNGMIHACLEASIGQTILLRGEAGIGKTRLVQEIQQLAANLGFSCHKGLVLDFGVGKDQDAVRTLVRSLLGIPHGTTQPECLAAAEKAVSDGRIDPDQRAFLNDLLDLPQPVELRAVYDAMDNAARNTRMQNTLMTLLRRFAADSPILAIVEDIHWADPQTLRYLASMATTTRDGPVVLLMTSRIEGEPLDQTWRSAIQGSPFSTLDLAPLRQDEAAALAAHFAEASNQFAKDCIERADGNPLFLEQLLQNAQEGASENVPGSIQSLVLARMDRLPAADKRALQAASIIGQRFELAALCHLLGDLDYDCSNLVVHFLVRPEGDGYLFAHALIREGAYSSLLKSGTRQLHRRAAEWYAERDPALRAQHLDRAEDPEAARAYLVAAEAQATAYQFERAQSLVDRGLTIATDPSDQSALTILRGRLLHDFGAIAESIAAYESALAIAKDDDARCKALIGLAAGMRIVDRFDDAFEALDKAEQAAVNSDHRADLARIHHIRGNLYFPLGQIDNCLENHRRSLDYARQAASPEHEASALSGLADAEYARGRMATAKTYFVDCVELSRQHGFGRTVVANLSMIGFSRQFLNEMDNALDNGLEAIKVATKIGHQRAVLMGEMLVVQLLYDMSDLPQAWHHLHNSEAMANKLGSRRFGALCLLWKARFLRVEGRRKEALEFLRTALANSRETGVGFVGPRILSELACTVGDKDTRRSALAEGEEILHAGAVGHNHLWFYRDAMEAALEAQDWAELSRYATTLEEFTRPEPLPWSTYFIARARVLAAWRQGNRDNQTREALQRLHDEAAQAGLRMSIPPLHEALASWA